jgi:leucyl-tRNA synthetase
VLNEQEWVTYDEALCVDKTVEIVCQINGKVKARLTIAVDEPKEDVIAQAKADEAVKALIEGKTVVKEIYVPNKLVNIVVK